ncbi:MAG: N-acetyltransferase [Thermoguttaceae bacterium]
MPNVVVQPVTTSRQRKQFFNFPWVLYRKDPNWVPPLRTSQKELLGYAHHHPFYEQNKVQTFVAYRAGELCGRIAAIVNYGHIERFSERRGFFGFFECVDDQEVATALFDAARGWLAEHDIHALRGPANPSLNYEWGLLIEGFDSPPTFLITYNKPYYQKLVEGYGFYKVQDLYSYGGQIDMLPKIRDKLRPIAEQIIERFNVRLRPLDMSRFVEDVEAFLDVFNRSMMGMWGFMPMTAGEVKAMAKELRYLMIPSLAVAAEIDGKMIGAVFAMPDYNPIIRKIDGRLFPFGAIRLLMSKRKIKKIRLISTNVLPEYQRLGIGLALMHGVAVPALEAGINQAEFSWVAESNSLSRGSLEKGGAQRQKTHRVYDWDPPGGGA